MDDFTIPGIRMNPRTPRWLSGGLLACCPRLLLIWILARIGGEVGVVLDEEDALGFSSPFSRAL